MRSRDWRIEGVNSFPSLAFKRSRSETKITIAKRIVRRLLLLSRASPTRSFHVNLAVTGAALGYYGAEISLTDSAGSASLKASCFRYSSKRSTISKKPFQNKLALDFKTLRATSFSHAIGRVGQSIDSSCVLNCLWPCSWDSWVKQRMV